MDLTTLIRDVPDFPKEGIVFKDITPLLADGDGFRQSVDELAEKFATSGATKIVDFAWARCGTDAIRKAKRDKARGFDLTIRDILIRVSMICLTLRAVFFYLFPTGVHRHGQHFKGSVVSDLIFGLIEFRFQIPLGGDPLFDFVR